MIVIDANLLIYSYDQHYPEHAKSIAWMEAALSGDEPVGLPWQCISAFLRVVTNQNLRGVRARIPEAIAVVESWLGSSNVQVLVAGPLHWPLLQKMMIEGQAPGKLVSDAVIAALTIEYGGVLFTADRDFARFPRLRWVNPLQE